MFDLVASTWEEDAVNRRLPHGTLNWEFRVAVLPRAFLKLQAAKLGFWGVGSTSFVSRLGSVGLFVWVLGSFLGLRLRGWGDFSYSW